MRDNLFVSNTTESITPLREGEKEKNSRYS